MKLQSIEFLRDKYVTNPSSKNIKLSEEVFDEVVDATGGKYAYTQWLLKFIAGTQVAESSIAGVATFNGEIPRETIKFEDVYKWKNFINIFKKHKSKFPMRDINSYKTVSHIRIFESKCLEIIDLISKAESSENSENFVSAKGIFDLESAGIEYVGMLEKDPDIENDYAYQVFKISTDLADSKQALKAYNDHLMRSCAGGANTVNFCTKGDRMWKSYLGGHSSDDLFVFFNTEDENSPYQLHFESDQYMNRFDKPIAGV